MGDQLYKLRPDRDLQCYFLQPTAVAALSQTSPTGFTVSGSWRQQFDWAVIEWNRDNIFEHPALRNLPDGDLSGVILTYQETRTNCIPLDSTIYPMVDWPYLRVWADANGLETIYRVNLASHATPVGCYTQATAQMQLQGAPTTGDIIELAWLDQHFNYKLANGDTLEAAANALAAVITDNQSAGLVSAVASNSVITLTYLGGPGSNGNRIGIYGTVSGAGTESWAPVWTMFSGGTSPATWQITLNFGALQDVSGAPIPTANVRKLRWTYAADLQQGNFVRSEFSVDISQWNVGGANLNYYVPGPGSRRIEDTSPSVSYQGSWANSVGNYSGGSIHSTMAPGASVRCVYTHPVAHSLYLGTRSFGSAAPTSVQIDESPISQFQLQLTGEDVLVRIPLGTQSGGVSHSVTVIHNGTTGEALFFDFMEMALPVAEPPTFAPSKGTALATDWDTLHSQALAPERTAWLIQSLGFHARENHYAGALWFYEICPQNQPYASATICFSGTPAFGGTTQLSLGPTCIQHMNLIGDTADSIATALALLVNAGSTGVWASVEGNALTITSRETGAQGNSLSVSVETNNSSFTAVASGPTLSGGQDGQWITDLNALPRINRAARDWTISFFNSLKSYGIKATASFSMELGNGCDSVATGIAQRYPDGSPVWLNTPSLQTNFGPASTAFWQQTYADMASLMGTAGLDPYLQFGEVQWWYFANSSGMPFYDSYATSLFEQTYGREMAVIPSQTSDPASYPDECLYLSGLIGTFTSSVMDYVRRVYPDAIFEVLYPTDTNDTALNRIVNYPGTVWTPGDLACLKTENFTYTGDRNLDGVRSSIDFPMQLGFSPGQASHLTGIGDFTTPWKKERQLAIAAGVESVVLFALDQLCLIGYDLPLDGGAGRAWFQGA